MRRARSAVDPVVILGGGLTGISTAVHLRRARGCCSSARTGWAGTRAPTSATGTGSTRPATGCTCAMPASSSMVDELLPGQMVAIARKARIFSHGVLTRYPYQANLHGLPPDVIKECLLGVIEASSRRRRRRRDPGELRGLLPAPLRRGDLEALHDSVQREDLGRAPARDHAGVVLAVRAAAQSGAGGRGRGGRRAARDGLQPELPVPEVRRHRDVHARAADPAARRPRVHPVQPDAVDWRRREVVVGGERIHYRALVATIPLPELLRRMPELPPEIETPRGQPALHDAALPEHRRARPAARRLALDLRAREALSVLSRQRILDRDAQHGARRVLVDLRRDGRSRADHRRHRARHHRGAGRRGRAGRRERRRVRGSAADRIRVRGLRPELLRGDARHLLVPGGERDLPARPLRRVDVQRDGRLPARRARGRGAGRRDAER